MIDELPLDEVEAKKIWKLAAKYTIIFEKLYKIGRVHVEKSMEIRHCPSPQKVPQRTCETHVNKQSLVHKLQATKERVVISLTKDISSHFTFHLLLNWIYFIESIHSKSTFLTIEPNKCYDMRMFGFTF